MLTVGQDLVVRLMFLAAESALCWGSCVLASSTAALRSVAGLSYGFHYAAFHCRFSPTTQLNSLTMMLDSLFCRPYPLLFTLDSLARAALFLFL